MYDHAACALINTPRTPPPDLEEWPGPRPHLSVGTIDRSMRIEFNGLGVGLVHPVTHAEEQSDARTWGFWLRWRNYDGRWGINGFLRGLIADVHGPLEPAHHLWNVVY